MKTRFVTLLVLCCGAFGCGLVTKANTPTPTPAPLPPQVSAPAPTAQASPVAAAQQGGLPEGAGKATVEMVCSACHTTQYLTDTQRTAPQWAMIMDLMMQFGAQASMDDWKQIHTYLYGTLALIDVNKDVAMDLQDTMGVDATVADAIVKGRPYKAVDDLKKVPGIDAAKVDAMQARFVFN